jgi:hypothetical protein
MPVSKISHAGTDISWNLNMAIRNYSTETELHSQAVDTEENQCKLCYQYWVRVEIREGSSIGISYCITLLWDQLYFTSTIMLGM